MNVSVEQEEKLTIHLEQSWIRFLMRVRKLRRGVQYEITFVNDPRFGPTWSITEKGKVERGLRINGLDSD